MIGIEKIYGPQARYEAGNGRERLWGQRAPKKRSWHMKEILIIGGGAAGMAAALGAAESAEPVRVTILEGLDRIGKKILATGNGRCNLSNEHMGAEYYHTGRRDRLEELLAQMILEGLDRIGKKILATGNGRCNLSNEHMGAEYYHTGRRDRLEELLAQMPTDAAVDFFRRQGLVCTADEAGRLYPYCRQASMVLDVLRLALERRGVQVVCGCKVTEAARRRGPADEAGRLYPYCRQASMVLDVLRLALERRGVQVVCGCKVTEAARRRGRFAVKTAEGKRYEGDALILTTGGKAAPAQGVTGVGYTLARGFGHRCTPLYPALTPLKCSHSGLKGLKGIRVQCGATLLCGGQRAAREEGEVQLTEYP